ncbi:MAG: hypothetical protein K8S55_08750 [Phycisphaerae bacterium]|nr:hypothetical protein [Phycisphaerae bacterium]
MTVEAQAADWPEKPDAGWTHFGIVAGLLLAATIGWTVTMDTLKWYTRKEPVAWPENVQVDQKTFRNISLPKQFGKLKDGTYRYRRVEDGEIKRDKNGKPIHDDWPDGEIIHRHDMLETLKIGTTLDEKRYADRESNWYVARIYEDTTEPKGSPLKYWQLGIEYYTGSEVTVPHVPDICVLAGGARPIGDGRKVLPVKIPGVPAPWDTDTELVALAYEKASEGVARRYVQYYLFSVNGVPEENRDKVRLILTKLTLRYVYYAKMQFFPYAPNGVRDMSLANAKAKEFLRNSLPAILRELPSAERIEQMHKSQGTQKK